jgi:hypothetical protein
MQGSHALDRGVQHVVQAPSVRQDGGCGDAPPATADSTRD